MNDIPPHENEERGTLSEACRNLSNAWCAVFIDPLLPLLTKILTP